MCDAWAFIAFIYSAYIHHTLYNPSYWIADVYGLRAALLTLAVLLLVACGTGTALLRYSPPAAAQMKQARLNRGAFKISDVIDFSFFFDPVFAANFLSLSLTACGYFIPFAHLIRFAQDVGVGDSAPFLFSVLGISNMFG